MSGAHVVVVGGGLAGLSAGIACADAGARVTLLESRPRLGGATFSTRLGGLEVDNGQHVFLRCCTAYRDFLARLGVTELTELQSRLSVPVLAPGGRRAAIRRVALPRPAHLAPSLLGFRLLSLADRLHAGLTTRRLGALDRDEPALDRISFGAWLEQQGESEAAIARFWDLFVRATLNISAHQASLQLAAMVYQVGLLEDATAGDIGWSRVPLSRLHGDPAAEALRKAGAAVHLRSRVTRVDGAGVQVDGQRLAADAVILAAPHEAAAELLPEEAGVDTEALRSLGRSPIVNLHVLLDRPVIAEPFVATVDSPLQWMFDRSAGAGLERGQLLAVSLSDAGAWLGRPRSELQAMFERALAELVPESRGVRVEQFFVTNEPAATFRQGPGCGAARPGAPTALPGLSLAGAWTDTGWPATMEGAVLSGRTAAREALRHLSLPVPRSLA
jgi:squalene-associated FAD-dependent desaturase